MKTIQYNSIESIHNKSRQFHLYIIILLLLMVIGVSQNLRAQCVSPPAAGICSEADLFATNGMTINSGQTFWFTGEDTFSDGVTLNAGGTLRICGDLTLNTMNFNGGNLIVEAGGILTINGSDTLYLNGNSLISNRGTLNINRSIILQKSNNVIINATDTATINMDFAKYSLVINSSTSKFINNGIANIYKLSVQDTASVGAVCLGAGSCLNVSVLINDFTNSFYAPSGAGVIRYSVTAILNMDLTSTEGIYICEASESFKIGWGTFGSAIVSTDCNHCRLILASLLPVELISFEGRQNHKNITLYWATATEVQNDYFTIEKSIDGVRWNEIGKIEGAGNSTSTLNYTLQDDYPQNGIQYYRLKQTDFDGRFALSEVISIHFKASAHTVSIYPNPNSSNYVNITGFDTDTYSTLELKNVTGELLYTTAINSQSVELPVIGRGIYMLTIVQDGGLVRETFKYVVQ